jgi:molecular chaperone IbpA
MRNVDFTPLYRSTVGFDHFADMLDRVFTNEVSQTGYPPFNIEKTDEDAYRISVAVAGFAEEDFNIEVRDHQLLVSVRKAPQEDEQAKSYLHRGIAQRGFEKRFQLADHVRVTNASYENGLLHIDLVREVPEALRPRRIEISGTKTIEAKPVTKKSVAA